MLGEELPTFLTDKDEKQYKDSWEKLIGKCKNIKDLSEKLASVILYLFFWP